MVAATALLEPGSRVRVRFGAGTRPPGAELALRHWLESQLAGAERAAAMIRPFADGEFGRGAEAPSPAHLAAANRLLGGLRRLLREGVTAEREAVAAALADPSPAHLDRVGRLEESYAATVAASEKVWQFYRDIFGQRQTRIAPRLLACDRIGLDCYQAVYQGLGKARSIPAPAPFAYMESGRGPATYRRDILLSKIARLPNPFPLIKLPYHRLVAPWTLGAVPHEIGHNLQSDLDLWREIPGRIPEDLRRAGISTEVARIWARWHKEMFADLVGTLLLGPAFVTSLTDVVGRSPDTVMRFRPQAVHPVPWMRVLIDLELLARMGFEERAAALRRAWLTLHPPSRAARLPKALRESFARAGRTVVSTIAFTPYPQLGGRSLVEVVRFRPRDEVMAREAAVRLARGQDPGIVPERFLIAAVRLALERRLAPPALLARRFFDALGRR